MMNLEALTILCVCFFWLGILLDRHLFFKEQLDAIFKTPSTLIMVIPASFIVFRLFFAVIVIYGHWRGYPPPG